MMATVKLAALLPFVALATAVPFFNSRQTGDVTQCKPNFQGNAVSIVTLDPNGTSNDNVLEWSVENFDGAPIQLVSQSLQDSLQNGEFFVAFTGQPQQTYNIKLTADTTRSLVATVSGGELNLANIIQGSKTQEFDINCNQCTEHSVAYGCQVSYPPTGQCVLSGGDGTQLVLGSCDNAEAFHIIEQLSAGDAASIHIDS